MIDATVWTCPDCGATYRMPGHWETAVYLAARRTAQVVHASRHGRRAFVENRRRASDARPPGALPVEWADPVWVSAEEQLSDGPGTNAEQPRATGEDEGEH